MLLKICGSCITALFLDSWPLFLPLCVSCWLQDPYGNYVVQYILGICSREEAEALVHVPIGKVRTKTGSKKYCL